MSVTFTAGEVEMNMSNMNAQAFVAMMNSCAKLELDYVYGKMDVATARRIVIAVRAMFESRAGKFVRDDEVQYGKPRTQEDGTIEMRPLRLMSQGIDREYLKSKLEMFEKLVESAERDGVNIQWS